MKEFGKRYFKDTIYINFDNNEVMKNVFEIDFDISRIISAIKIEYGKNFEVANTLIIFDEIQEAPKALASLKYFYENAPQYAIIAAGSLLGVALHQGTSFPVGKVDFMHLYPLNFSGLSNDKCVLGKIYRIIEEVLLYWWDAGSGSNLFGYRGF